MKKKRTGVLGGTFNPVHIGHLLLAQWAKEEAGLDEVLFLPAGVPYMKEQDRIAEKESRLEMLSLATADRADFRVSDIEIRRPGNTYTYETMEELNRTEFDTEFFFIMGADCLFSIDTWKYPERIFASCNILAAARNHSSMRELEKQKQYLEKKYGADITLLSFPEIAISSTDIRKRIQEGKSVRYMVTDPVAEYLKRNRLYRENIDLQE